MENECKKNTFAAPAFVYLYPMHSVFISFSPFFPPSPVAPHPQLFIVVYASSKKVVKKPLEKFIYVASFHTRRLNITERECTWRLSQNEN